MDEKRSKKKISSYKTAITTTVASSDTIHLRRHKAQNFLLIWADAHIDQSQEDYRNTLTQLRNVTNDINIFTQPNDCIQFLKNIDKEKAFVIVSGSLGQHLVPSIHSMPQLDAIYIFCANKVRHEQWTNEWTKIKGVHTKVKPICEALEMAAKQCNQDSVAVSFVTVSEGSSNQDLDQLEPSFMYTQILKEILLEMKYVEKSIKQLATYCRIFTKTMKKN
jgi:hypothetical protein